MRSSGAGVEEQKHAGVDSCGNGFIEADVIRWKEACGNCAAVGGPPRAVYVGERLVTDTGPTLSN